jgi:hypothetical protein
MLRTISAAISKARMEALARSMILTDNMNAKKAPPREFYPDGISRTHLNCSRCHHPETTDNYKGHVPPMSHPYVETLAHHHPTQPQLPSS